MASDKPVRTVLIVSGGRASDDGRICEAGVCRRSETVRKGRRYRTPQKMLLEFLGPTKEGSMKAVKVSGWRPALPGETPSFLSHLQNSPRPHGLPLPEYRFH
jgi:hypothetical protein